jgi:myo-inositol-1(or 4)-monophosphatase
MSEYLDTAINAAREAGSLLRLHFGGDLDVNTFEAHDIKLDLDVQSQQLITDRLLAAFPGHAIFGEEGIAGNQSGRFQWIIDPIDGTVNYFYGLPHFCISIALREAGEIILGVIYDPMRDELWQVEKGGVPLLNGRTITVSQRDKIGDAFVSVGFSKSKTTINAGMPLFEQMIHRVRKCRLMGSAALDMAYVASGRLDAYIESQVSLWDVAAGILLIEAAGGKVVLTPIPGTTEKYAISATSGRIDFTA